jgi:hypothetical protein
MLYYIVSLYSLYTPWSLLANPYKTVLSNNLLLKHLQVPSYLLVTLTSTTYYKIELAKLPLNQMSSLLLPFTRSLNLLPLKVNLPSDIIGTITWQLTTLRSPLPSLTNIIEILAIRALTTRYNLLRSLPPY